MNIFFISRKPDEIAAWAIDAHVPKMILECAQMLTATHQGPRHTPGFGYTYPRNVYNHPCTKWIRQSSHHYHFVYKLMLAYAFELAHRYDTKHMVFDRIVDQLKSPPDWLKPNGWTDPPMAMPDYYKVPGDCVASYRKYYNEAKRFDKRGKCMHRWKRRDKPEWIT